MFKKVLVANRGEIAIRIIRALREMGIESVAIYSEADRHALHTELADEAICIGPAKVLDSYADPVAVIGAALATGVDAIHPGYGFLSENSNFVGLCEDVGIKFIGPSSKVIDLMGNKHHARQSMRQAGVPVTPGSHDLIEDLEEAKTLADKLGYPVMIKASDGGGGKGMRKVNHEGEFKEKFNQAWLETEAVYGNHDLYLEKVIENARHIEVQLLADQAGHVIHLGERDCSIQRNNQKIVEIAPAPGLSESVRQAMRQAAVKAAAAIGYENAGTIEFLLSDSGDFYFMEMNTRLQVEHPISEMITQVDIVKEQIRIAAGLDLAYNQEDIQLQGYSIEVRLNAENPLHNFMPSSGKIQQLILPSGGLGLRVESAMYPTYEIPPYYDSMVAKIISHHKDFEGARRLMQRALYEVVIDGISTNIELLESLIFDDEIQWDQINTTWMQEVFLPQWLEQANKEE